MHGTMNIKLFHFVMFYVMLCVFKFFSDVIFSLRHVSVDHVASYQSDLLYSMLRQPFLSALGLVYWFMVGFGSVFVC